jgi:hypothetical protein
LRFAAAAAIIGALHRSPLKTEREIAAVANLIASWSPVGILAVVAALAIGFLAGYGVRARISRNRRQKWLRAQGR